MKSSFDVTAAVKKIVHHFRIGALCPAEMWRPLADALALSADVDAALDALPADVRAELRQSYRERPLSFAVLRGHRVRRELKRWCRTDMTG
jgi:hypothetical protein